jgi:hypothetical protein
MPRSLAALLALFFVLPLSLHAQPHPHSHTARAIQFPDVPGGHTLQMDLHTHTVFSDGSVWPDIRVQEALRDGLDAVAMTDHLEYQPHQDDIPHPDRNRAYEVAREEAAAHDLIVINGSEITRSMPPGHTNAVFLEDANPLLQDDPRAVFREANRQGAFVFWNHPMWTPQRPSGRPALTEMHRTLIEQDLLHGIEVVNKHKYSAGALRIALEHDLTIVGTSDVHGLIDWDYEVHAGGHRPVTLVFAEERSKAGLKAALEDGRTAVWHRNTLIGRASHVLPLLKASLSVVDAQYRPNTSVVDVRIANRSDARFLLDNQTEVPFHTRSDVVPLAPQDTTRLLVKPGARQEALTLRFEVLNAVTAPATHPTITFEVVLPEAQEETDR